MYTTQHAAKESLQPIVFREQWPPIYHLSKQLQHSILTAHHPQAHGLHEQGHKLLPYFIKQYLTSDTAT